jgi:signal transduction histidine kinase
LTFNRLLDRLDQAFERQRRFIADASHELRTPVAILQGESEVALSRAGRSPEEYRESLGILQHEARRLARIVEDMFTLSRADAGQYPVAPRELYLDELAAECVQSVRTLAAAKSISVAVETDGELPAVADGALLSQLLLNLLDNAIKYTPEGGKITVRASSGPEGLEVAVADDGPGVPKELQARIFERFFRADPARTRANSGSGAGLGLAIAKWIAEVHRGSLELTRSDPTGSVFTFRLPHGANSPSAH